MAAEDAERGGGGGLSGGGGPEALSVRKMKPGDNDDSRGGGYAAPRGPAMLAVFAEFRLEQPSLGAVQLVVAGRRHFNLVRNKVESGAGRR